MEKYRYALKDIQQMAAKLRNDQPASKVYAFHGQMGAGKTTFITAFCKELGVKGTVSSPTFSIINEYAASDDKGQIQPVYHIDLYRLKGRDEAIQAGVEEVIYGKGIALVEWPEIAPDLFPESTVHVYLTGAENEGREIAWQTGGKL
jgi:tRNA threonylcarbamoyladenosine biosynthesis protein TsaE